jgi:hypothetical protein
MARRFYEVFAFANPVGRAVAHGGNHAALADSRLPLPRARLCAPGDNVTVQELV